MYTIFENVIKRGAYELTGLLNKIDSYHVEGKLSNYERDALYALARGGAKAENGADAPVVGLDVDFVQLENTEEYARYAGLQSVHLYDTVHVISGPSDIRAGVRMTGYVYDVAADKPVLSVTYK